jgi:hypothetical protein
MPRNETRDAAKVVNFRHIPWQAAPMRAHSHMQHHTIAPAGIPVHQGLDASDIGRQSVSLHR